MQILEHRELCPGTNAGGRSEWSSQMPGEAENLRYRERGRRVGVVLRV